MIPVRVLSDKLDGKLRVFAARVESRLALVSTAARPDLYAAKILSKNKDYIQIQTFPFSGFPASALKSVMDSKTVIANARTKVTSTNHTNRAVRVLRSRVTLTPQLASTRRPSSGSAKRDAADRHDVRLDVPRRAFPAAAAAAAAEIIEQAHCSTIPYPSRDLRDAADRLI